MSAGENPQLAYAETVAWANELVRRMEAGI